MILETATALICMAHAIYFEARSESTAAQMAVGHVILNRVEDPRYPDNVCDVVTEGMRYSSGQMVRDKCQFSFYCDGKSDNPRNKQAWFNALYIAHLSGLVDDVTDGATHYHSTKVFPEWAYTGEVTTKIHKHVFYKGVL